MYVGAAIGSLGRHTATDPTTGYLVFTNGTKVFLQVLYATQLTTTLTFGFTKLSVLLFYKRVFRGEFFNAVVWANIGIVSVWTSAFFFANLLQCYPIAVNWSEYGADPYQCINTNEMYLAQAWSDIFTDLAILAVPIPCIWALQMPAKHKFAVSGIFLLGLLTVGAGTAKLVVIKKVIDWSSSAYGNGDITWMQSPSIYWGMIESSLGIVGACLPLFRPLFHGASSRGFVRHLRSVALPSMHSKEVSKSSGGESGSIALHGASNGSSNGCKTAGSETLKASDKESYVSSLEIL